MPDTPKITYLLGGGLYEDTPTGTHAAACRDLLRWALATPTLNDDDRQLVLKATHPAPFAADRVDLILAACSDWWDLIDAGDEMIAAAVALPHTDITEQRRILDDIRGEEEVAGRFDGVCSKADLEGLLDDWWSVRDFLAVAELESDRWHQSARTLAEKAVCSDDLRAV